MYPVGGQSPILAFPRLEEEDEKNISKDPAPLELEEESVERPTLETAKETMEIEPERALALLEKMIANPRDPTEQVDAYLLRAKVLFIRENSGDPFRAQKDLKNALDVLSEKSVDQANWRKAEVHRYFALIAWNKGLPKQAQEHFKQALEICPTHSKVLCEMIEFFLEEKRVSEAKELCERVLKEEGLDPACFSTCAKVYDSLGKWDELFEICKRCLKNRELSKGYQIEMVDYAIKSAKKLNDPESTRFYLQRACELDFFDPARFQDLFKVVLKDLKLPDDFQEKRLKGAIALVEVNREEALRILDEVLQDPKSLELYQLADAHLARAKALIKEEKYDATRFELDIVNTLPLNGLREVDFHLLNARLWIENEAFEDAERHFWKGWRVCEKGQACGREKDFVKEFLWFFINRKKFDEAINLCKDAERRCILNSSDTLYLQIQIYKAQGNACQIKRIGCGWPQLKDSSKQLEILDLLAEMSEADSERYKYLLKAYEIAPFSDLRERFSALRQLYERLENKTGLIPPDPRSFEQVRQAALAEQDPTKIRLLLNQYNFEALDFKELLHRAKAHAKVGEVALAKEDLKQARSPKPLWLEWRAYRRWKKNESKRLLAFAEVASIEGKLAEALTHFEKGWDLWKGFNFAKAYIEFLKKGKNFSEALRICQEAEKYKVFLVTHFHLYRAEIFFEAEEWPDAERSCSMFLELKEIKREQQLRVCKIGFESCMRMEHFRKARQYALTAYRKEADALNLRTDALNFIERSEELLRASRAILVEEHLEQLLRKNARLPLSRKKGYLSGIFRAYEAEFQTHQKKREEILQLLQEEET